MRPKQRKVAAKNMLELRTAGWTPTQWVRYFSVSSMSMLQLRRFVLCQDEFSKALTLLRRGTRFGAAPRGDGASETQFLSSFRNVEQLFPDWEDEHNFLHFRVSPMRKAANAWVSCIRTVRPQCVSIQTRQARKRSVTVILAQRENPLIEISAILTQCDRALIGILRSPLKPSARALFDFERYLKYSTYLL